MFPCNKSMRLYHEEQFGPVIPVVSFDKLQDVLEYFAESKYGQQASVFSDNASDELGELLDDLVHQVSRVNINTQCQRGPDSFPFTGRKDSAVGTLSVRDALLEFSIPSMIATKKSLGNETLVRETVQHRRSKFLSGEPLF